MSMRINTVKAYSGEKLHSLGVMRVQVQYNDQCSYLNLYVVNRGGPALFGREWLKSIQLDWTKMIKSLTLNANATGLAFTNFGTASCLRCNFALIPLTQPISSLKTSWTKSP
jgi:hypothetical protein